MNKKHFTRKGQLDDQMITSHLVDQQQDGAKIKHTPHPAIKKRKINSSTEYEISVPQIDGKKETFTISGADINQILTCYFNVTKFNQMGYVKMKGGAIVSEKAFFKFLKNEHIEY